MTCVKTIIKPVHLHGFIFSLYSISITYRACVQMLILLIYDNGTLLKMFCSTIALIHISHVVDSFWWLRFLMIQNISSSISPSHHIPLQLFLSCDTATSSLSRKVSNVFRFLSIMKRFRSRKRGKMETISPPKFAWAWDDTNECTIRAILTNSAIKKRGTFRLNLHQHGIGISPL